MCATSTVFSEFAAGSLALMFLVCIAVLVYHAVVQPALGRSGRLANNIRVATFAGCTWAW